MKPGKPWPKRFLSGNSRISNLYVWVVYICSPLGTVTGRGLKLGVLFFTFVFIIMNEFVSLLSMITILLVMGIFGPTVVFSM